MEIWIIAPGVVNMRRYIDFDISCISKMAKITKTYFFKYKILSQEMTVSNIYILKAMTYVN